MERHGLKRMVNEDPDWFTREQSGKKSELDFIASNLTITSPKALDTALRSDHRMISIDIKRSELSEGTICYNQRKVRRLRSDLN